MAMASCIKHFHIDAYELFVLFQKYEGSGCEKETFIYSLLLFNLILYLNLKIGNSLFFLSLIYKKSK